MSGMTLRQRLSLMADQAKAERNNFVETALREALDSLNAYDARVTELLKVNSDLVDARRARQAERDQYFMMLWLLVENTKTRTIMREDVAKFPGTRAELIIETNKATKDVVVVARTKE